MKTLRRISWQSSAEMSDDKLLAVETVNIEENICTFQLDIRLLKSQKKKC